MQNGAVAEQLVPVRSSMSSQVYYRKWRPRRFDQVVGQQPVTQTLQQAIARGRVAHAYLFCGPRGTGKTSTARILAKAVNCLGRSPDQGEPCERCALCTAVNNGALMDLIEIDAASNRGIDEIRGLREKVHFAPSEARYKVYILDEVHMLTEAACNAFLKTLEEPPAHTIFVLATTEPHQVPATIVSRCQRFDFRRISLPDIVERLAQVCGDEGVDAEPEALRTIARAAWGSLRDAENLLEQLVTSYGARIGMKEVRDLLGLTGDDRALALVKHVLTGNTTQGLQVVNAIASEGLDLRQLHRQVVDYLRAALLLKSGARETVEHPRETVQELSFLASGVSLEHLLKTLKLFGSLSFRYDSPSPLPLELAVVEATLKEEQPAAPSRPAREGAPTPSPQGPAISGPPPPREEKRDAQRSRPVPTPGTQPAPARAEDAALKAGRATPPAQPEEHPAPQEAPAGPPPSGSLAQVLESQWPAILKSLGRYKGRRFFLGGLLRDCTRREVANGAVTLWFAHRSHMERVQEEMEDPRCRRDVAEVFQKALGGAFEVRLACQGNGPGTPQNGPRGHLVRAALGMGGKIVQEETTVQEDSADAQ